MNNIGVFVFILLVPTLLVPSASQAVAHHRRVHRVHRHIQHHSHEYAHAVRPRHRYYVVRKHRTKLQHAKIIGGTAKTGASVGGLIAGPPGAAAGAAAGAATGTAYDLKTRKKKVYK